MRLFSLIVFLILFALVSHAQIPGEEKVICGQPKPAGWVVTEVGDLCNPGDPLNLDNYNRKIKYVEGLPTGTKLLICADVRPVGWVNISADYCKHIGNSFYISHTIQKIEGLPAGSEIEINDDVPPPGWITTDIRLGTVLIGQITHIRDIKKYEGLPPGSEMTIVDDKVPPGWVTTKIGTLALANSIYQTRKILKIEGMDHLNELYIEDEYPPPGWITTDYETITIGATLYEGRKILRVSAMSPDKEYTLGQMAPPAGWIKTNIYLKPVIGSLYEMYKIRNYVNMKVGDELEVCQPVPQGWELLRRGSLQVGNSFFETFFIKKNRTLVSGVHSGTWTKSASPYFLTGNISIPKGETLTIEPGVEIHSENSSFGFTVDGTLIAKGTATDSIKFLGFADPANPQYSSHGGTIQFSSSSTGSVLDYVVIDRWGESSFQSWPGALRIASSSLSVTNSRISNSEENAVYLEENAAPVISDISFVNNPVSINGGVKNLGAVKNNRNALIKLLNEDLTTDAVLNKPGPGGFYVLNGGFTVKEGARLDLQPGVEIRSYNYYDRITVNGTLTARGNALDSIKFKGFAAANSTYSTHGGTIYFGGSSSNSELEYVLMDRMGDSYFNNTPGAIYIGSSSVSVKHVLFTDCEENAVFVGGTVKPVISDNRFAKTPFAISASVNNLGNIRDNLNALIVVRNEAAVQNSVVPRQASGSYYQLGQNGFTINEGVTTTIEPGVEVRIKNYSAAIVVNGTLIAKGTATDSIRFRGFADPEIPMATHAGNITFSPGSKGSVLQFVSFDHLGETSFAFVKTPAVSVETGDIIIRQCSFNNAEGTAIDITAVGASPDISQSRFSGNLKDIRAQPSSCSALLNNPGARIFLAGGNVGVNCTLPYPGEGGFYTLEGSITVNPSFSLMIEPGVLIDFSGSSLTVQGTLKAAGTQTRPIQFAHLHYSPSQKDGGSVYLNASSSGSVLKYVTFDRLGVGFGSGPALTVSSAGNRISDITISNSVYYGLRYEGSGTDTIFSSSILNNPVGIMVTSGAPVLKDCNIYSSSEFGVLNSSSNVVDARGCYWGHPSGPKHPTSNPAGLGNAVSDRVLFNPWQAKPLNGQRAELLVAELVSPVSDCNLSVPQVVKVKITNSGNLPLSGFSLLYSLNGAAQVSEVPSGSMLPGISSVYEFSAKANMAATGDYRIRVWAVIPETGLPSDTLTKTIHHFPSVTAPANLRPLTGASGIEMPLTLLWDAVEGAAAYDVYLWKSSEPLPAAPLVAGLNQISYTVPSGPLQYNAEYKWKVVSRSGTCYGESAVQSFRTRLLPDLEVDSIRIPASAISETPVRLNWTVKNTGGGDTQTGWQDLVYLSDHTSTGVGTDFYIGQFDNFSSLKPGASYRSGSVDFTLPRGIEGTWYVIVKTNAFNSVTEASRENNTKVWPLTVSLTPPPDLQVTDLSVAPSVAFSEDSLMVGFTVRNAGKGPAKAVRWTDRVYLSKEESFIAASSVLLYSKEHSADVAPEASYRVDSKVKIPGKLNDVYFVHVVTDQDNRLFEYNKEDNNVATSQAVTIVLRPAPDLVIDGVSASSDTVAGNQLLTLTWMSRNNGPVAAAGGWREDFWLSSDNSWNSDDTWLGSYTRNDSLRSLGVSPAQASFKVPVGLAGGTYYVLAKTDAGNIVDENEGENNNVSPPGATIVVTRPDLTPVSLNVASSLTSEQKVTLSWQVRNDSRAGIYNAAWMDRIYLSADETAGSGQDFLLAETSSSVQFVPPGGTYTKQATITIPAGISGKQYLVLAVNSDERNNLPEAVTANNSLAVPVTVKLTPWADLSPEFVNVPGSGAAGSVLAFTYKVTNTGDGPATSGKWTDSLYLAPVSEGQGGHLIALGAVKNTFIGFQSGGSYQQSPSFILPVSLTSGQYRVVLRCDALNEVFEHTGEQNNEVQSNIVNIAELTAVDLAVTSGGLLSADVTAGQPVKIQWTVKNNSHTASLVPSWTDGIYLSSNPALDASDRLIGSVVVKGPLAAGETYTKTLTVTIPRDATGTIYLLVNSDKDNTGNDPVRGNNYIPLNANGGGGPVTVIVPPPADLIPVAFTSSGSAVSSQPLLLNWKVKNAGTGNTEGDYWTDRVYLSQDNTLDLMRDPLLGTFVRNGKLAPGAEYTASGRVSIPQNVAGSYVLLLVTDAANHIYEAEKELNNTAFLDLQVGAQDPSDLQVSNISAAKPEFQAGSPASVTWNLHNNGRYTASGLLREAVYLSADTLSGPGDVLLDTVEARLLLPPSGSIERKVSTTLKNVPAGDYYVIVRTDILNNILESDEDNNTSVSLSGVKVTVKELKLNIAQKDTIQNQTPLYYRMEIPEGLTRETLSLQLTATAQSTAVTRLFMSRGKMPDANNFDFRAALPNSAAQNLVIPELMPGTWYIMAEQITQAKESQPVNLLAKVIPFSVTGTDAAEGGNTGLVTVKISGAKFNRTTRFGLKGKTGRIISPYEVHFSDNTSVFATFNLLGAETGVYDVFAVNVADTSRQVNGFTVTKGPGSAITGPGGSGGGPGGGPGGGASGFTCQITNIGFEDQLQTDIVHPASVLIGRVAAITIFYQNNGTVDIPAPTRYLISLSDGVPVGFSVADLDKNLKDLVLECKEEGGPPGILRPGASGFFKVYTKSVLRTVRSIDLVITD